MPNTSPTPHPRIGVAILDSGFQFGPAVLDAVRANYHVRLNGECDVAPCVPLDPDERHGEAMCELVLETYPEAELYLFTLPEGVDLCEYLPRLFEQIRAMPEVTVVNMSWVFRPYSGCIADENYWLTAAGGLLEEMAEGGKLMVMATGNIPAGDPSQSTPVDTYTPLLGRARPGFTVGTAERDGKRWKRHLSSRCRWLDPADDSKYVPDVYADGACRHHSGHWSSVATARASGHVARAALAFLTNSAGPLTRADVDALFASLRVTPHRVLVRPGELPLEWRWRKHPKRYCLI